jgi:hypothetical protein
MSKERKQSTEAAVREIRRVGSTPESGSGFVSGPRPGSELRGLRYLAV